MIYFNHFIKLHDHKVINRKYLWRLIAHGAAEICADFQYSIDLIIPFSYRDNKLQKNNVSAFFIQSKNDKAYQTTPQNYLFNMMDPYKIQFFDKDDKETTPVIRMVFALAPWLIDIMCGSSQACGKDTAFKGTWLQSTVSGQQIYSLRHLVRKSVTRNFQANQGGHHI